MSSVPRARERRRLAPDDRRAELSAAVRAVLTDCGYHGVTVPRIVAKAGVSQGTFYRYFDNLDHALRDVVAEALAPIAQLAYDAQVVEIETGADLEAVLLRYYRALAIELAANPRFVREVMVVIPSVEGSAGETARSFLRTMRQHARMLLASVNGRPPFRALDPQVAGSAIVGMVVGAAQEIAELGSAFAPEAWAMEMAKLEAGALLERTEG
jgi:AcrR family transcriptional regulator